jgi:hypothetical protein
VGLFSFVGKALGSVAKIGFNIATGNIGGAITQGLGLLHSTKAPMSGVPLKLRVLQQYGAQIARGNATQAMPGGAAMVNGITGARRPIMTAKTIRLSPVLPGGSIATRAGPVAMKGGVPPASYGGGSRSGPRKKHRSRSSRRSSSGRSGRKRSGGRKLKFGSPAWRKKYVKKRR